MDSPDDLLGILRRHVPSMVKDTPVQLAYLHGSAARGEQTPSSDVDIAFDFLPFHRRLQDAFLENVRERGLLYTLAARISLNYDVLLGPRVIAQARWHRSILYRNVSAHGIALASS